MGENFDIFHWRYERQVLMGNDGYENESDTTVHLETNGQRSVVNRTMVHLLRGYEDKELIWYICSLLSMEQSQFHTHLI